MPSRPHALALLVCRTLWDDALTATCSHALPSMQTSSAHPACLPQVTGAVGWRKEGIRYKKNEVFLDVIETVSMLMSAQARCCCMGGKLQGKSCGCARIGCRASRCAAAREAVGEAAPPNREPQPGSPCMLSLQGSVLRCDVQGRLVMKAFLSGMPDIKLGLNEKLEVRTVLRRVTEWRS